MSDQHLTDHPTYSNFRIPIAISPAAVGLDTDPTLASNSSTAAPSVSAFRTFIDATNYWVYQSDWSAAGNALPANAQAGWSYRIGTPGTVGTWNLQTDDLVIATVDNASTTNTADWIRIPFSSATAATAQVVADATARDALTGLTAGTSVIVIDNGGGQPASFDITVAGDGTWAGATKLQTAPEVSTAIVVADATARDALVNLTAGQSVFVIDDDGAGNAATYAIHTAGATFAAAGKAKASPEEALATVVADATARDALVNLQAGQSIVVVDNGGGQPAAFQITSAGATWAAAGKVQTAPGTTSAVVVADATARDALTNLTAGQTVFVVDDDGSGNAAIYGIHTDGATFAAAGTVKSAPEDPLATVVADTTARDALTNLVPGQSVVVVDNGGGQPASFQITTAGATWAAAGKVQTAPSSASDQIIADATARDALTGLQAGDGVIVLDDDGLGTTVSYKVSAITDGAWPTSSVVRTGPDIAAPIYQNSVLGVQTTPPGGPTLGDRYIVAAGGTGAWTTRDTQVASWDGAAWQFSVPLQDELRPLVGGGIYRWDGAAWTDIVQIPKEWVHLDNTNSAAYAVQDEDRIVISSAAAAATLNLPDNPPDQFTVELAGVNFDTNSLTVNSGVEASTFAGIASPFIMDSENDRWILVYDQPTNNWSLIRGGTGATPALVQVSQIALMVDATRIYFLTQVDGVNNPGVYVLDDSNTVIGPL